MGFFARFKKSGRVAEEAEQTAPEVALGTAPGAAPATAHEAVPEVASEAVHEAAHKAAHEVVAGAAPKAAPEVAPEAVPAAEASAAIAANQLVTAPIAGEVVPLAEVADEVFASGMLGKGCGIKPASGATTVVSPFAGTVTVTMDSSRHALGLTSDDGVELLLHVGIDTVGMEGEGFSYHVARNERVSAGQPLISFSREAIAQAGHDDTVMVIVSNTADFAEVELAASGEVNAGDDLLKLTR